MGAVDVKSGSAQTLRLVGRDIEAVRRLIGMGRFSDSKESLGWELEGCGTTVQGYPNLDTWKGLGDLLPCGRFSYQGEVGAHNFEVNGDATPFSDGYPFQAMIEAQGQAIRGLKTAGLNPVLSGTFLPLRVEDLGESKDGFKDEILSKILNPGRPRYRTILDCWRRQLGEKHLHLFKGHSNVWMHTFMIEVLMTSLHTHISISPDQIHTGLNIAAMISAVCQAPFVSSPRFLGKTGTWQDYRYQIWRQCFPGRTGMGPGWCQSLEDYFSKLMSYEGWLDSDNQEDPMEAVGRDEKVTLHHLPLHQGCLWWDVRPKFFNQAITIEERTHGSGSPFDNASKAALWTGLMRYYLREKPEVWKTFGAFETTEKNAEAVARDGLQARIQWFGRTVRVEELLVELFPLARLGHRDLYDQAISPYLDNVAEIVHTKRTPAVWISGTAKKLIDQGISSIEVDLEITRRMQSQYSKPAVDLVVLG
jgi:hypothetical protein